MSSVAKSFDYESHLWDDEEELRPIEGYDDYMVSNHGHVYSYRHSVDIIRLEPRRRLRKGIITEMTVRFGRSSGQKSIHRLVYAAFIGTLPPFIDHINGDASDNRVQNLRDATRQENNRNMRKRRRQDATLPRHVYKNRGGSKYCAKVRENGKEKYLGTFTTAEEAGSVAREFARNLYGEYWYGHRGE